MTYWSIFFPFERKDGKRLIKQGPYYDIKWHLESWLVEENWSLRTMTNVG